MARYGLERGPDQAPFCRSIRRHTTPPTLSSPLANSPSLLPWARRRTLPALNFPLREPSTVPHRRSGRCSRILRRCCLRPGGVPCRRAIFRFANLPPVLLLFHSCCLLRRTRSLLRTILHIIATSASVLCAVPALYRLRSSLVPTASFDTTVSPLFVPALLCHHSHHSARAPRHQQQHSVRAPRQ